MSLTYQTFIGWIQFFYLDVLGLAPLAMTWAWTVYTIWNMLNDPIAGQLSDRTSTRWGKRIPWIIGLSLPLGLSFFALWTPPEAFVAAGGSLGSSLWWYFLIVLLVFDSLWSAATINYVALFPVMYPAQNVRATVAGWRQAFAIVAVIVGVTFAKEIADSIGWGPMGALLGGLGALAFLLSLLGSFEPVHTAAPSRVSFRRAIAQTFASRSFRWFLVMSTAIEFTLVVLPAVLPLFAKYALGETDGLRQGLISGIAFVAAIPSFAFWTWMAKRKETRTSIIAALAVFGLLLIPLGFIANLAQGMVAAAGIGVGLAGLLMLREVMLADVIDEDALTVGTRREGMYFGMHGFVIRAAFAFQGALLGGMLALTGYDPDLAVQASEVELGLRALIIGAPIIGVGLGVYSAFRYPLHGQQLAAVKRGIDQQVITP